MLRPPCFRNEPMEDLEGGNLWPKLEALRCLLSTSHFCRESVPSLFQVVGPRICALQNYKVNSHLSILPTGIQYLLVISVTAQAMMNSSVSGSDSVFINSRTELTSNLVPSLQHFGTDNIENIVILLLRPWCLWCYLTKVAVYRVTSYQRVYTLRYLPPWER
jgi:hypothetical protein